MRRRGVPAVMFGAAVVTVSLAVGPAAAQGPAAGQVENLAKGKAVLERACGVCHGLERPFSKTFDKAGWESTVDRMRGNGAQVNAEEQAQVVAYLLAKNTFEAKCSVCHGTDRPLGASKSPADWHATVQRMASKRSGHLSDAEAAQIAAYLSVIRPAQK